MTARVRYLPLRKAADMAGLTPRELQHLAERGEVACGWIPGAARKLRRFRESDMRRLRERIEETFVDEGGKEQAAA